MQVFFPPQIVAAVWSPTSAYSAPAKSYTDFAIHVACTFMQRLEVYSQTLSAGNGIA